MNPTTNEELANQLSQFTNLVAKLEISVTYFAAKVGTNQPTVAQTSTATGFVLTPSILAGRNKMN